MKRSISIFLTFILIFGLLTTVLTSCKPEKIGSYDVTFFRPAFDMKNPEDNLTIMLNEYQEKYDAKIKIVSSTWMDWTTRLMTLAASGQLPDVVFTGSTWTVGQVNSGFLQPVEDYVDMKAEKFKKEQTKKIYYYNGHYWGVATGTLLWCVYYNKDMIDDAGLQDPYDLYKAGNWTFENFRKYTQQLTKKDVDGEITQYGYATWWWNFYWGNLGCFVTVDENGKISSGLKTQELINGLQFCRDMNNDGNYAPTDHRATFVNGISAMFIDRDFEDRNFYKYAQDGTINFEYGVVPFPYGPDNKEQLNIVDGDGYGIGKNCRNPQGAGKCIDYIVSGGLPKDSDNDIVNSEQMLEFYDSAVEHCYYPSIAQSAYTSAGLDVQNSIMSGVWSNESSISSLLASYESAMEEAVKEANEKYTQPVLDPFNPYETDFEDGVIPIEAMDENSKVEIVDNGISGKSLLLTPNAENSGAYNGYKFKLEYVKPVAYRYIQVEFDYKHYGDGVPSEDGNLAFVTENSSGEIYGRNSKDNFSVKTADTGSVKLVVVVPVENGVTDITLIIRPSGNMTPVLIDNLKITEYDQLAIED